MDWTLDVQFRLHLIRLSKIGEMGARFISVISLDVRIYEVEIALKLEETRPNVGSEKRRGYCWVKNMKGMKRIG